MEVWEWEWEQVWVCGDCHSENIPYLVLQLFFFISLYELNNPS